MSESLFLVAGLRPATLLKMRFWYRCFPVNFAEFLRTPFIIEHLWWLLLFLILFLGKMNLTKRQNYCPFHCPCEIKCFLCYFNNLFILLFSICIEGIATFFYLNLPNVSLVEQ